MFVQKVFSKSNWSNIFFNFICLLIIGRLLTRLIQAIHKIPTEYWMHSEQWEAFVLSMGTYLMIAVISYWYAKCFRILSMPVIFTGLLLFLYFLALFIVFLNIQFNFIFLWITFLIVCVPLNYRITKEKLWANLFPNFKDFNDILPRIIIVLWFAHSLLFCIEFNFNPARKPYGDEGTFWFIAAQQMFEQGVLKAHLLPYPAAGLHPFGIPFISALPINLLQGISVHSIYFMPVAVILGITFFLNQIRHLRWVFLFFILGLFCSFNNRSWVSQLCYQLVYGEGLSLLFFLAIVAGMVALANQDHISKREAVLFCFIIGLLAVSKLPLALMFPIFLLVFLKIYHKTHSMNESKNLLTTPWFILITFIPFILWKAFERYNQLPDATTEFNLPMFIMRLPQPNWFMLKKCVHDLLVNAQSMVYFSGLALLFVLVSRQKKYLFQLIPVLIFIVANVVYYAYVYAYGSQTGDSGSFVRYIMPMALALYYLGGLGFNEVMLWIEQQTWALPIKIFLSFILVALVMMKLY